jgi:hypothetical protein
MNQPKYQVLVDDNYHFQDEDERYASGGFDSYEDAVAKCKGIVEQCLEQIYKPGMTADHMYRTYQVFGEDPWIRGKPEGQPFFSAWDYARSRVDEICGPSRGVV